MTAAELRALAQRVVETWEAWAAASLKRGSLRFAIAEEERHARYSEAHRALARALDEPDAGLSVYSARAILAALDDAERVATERARRTNAQHPYATFSWVLSPEQIRTVDEWISSQRPTKETT